ncbi:MAG TPA: VCBS repeat-containing protein [Acidimicrobiales bacterium]|nr:VCBS repeat-containing protein [Acidimicrobiales bacterium]
MGELETRQSPWTRRLLFLALGVVAVLALGAQHAHQATAAGGTPVCGDIPDGTVWTSTGSPYVLCAAGATVHANATLLIDASTGPVTVQAQDGGYLFLDGTLRSLGTSATNSILFTGSPTPGSWRGVVGTGTIELANTRVSYATTALAGGDLSLTNVSTDHTTTGAIRSGHTLTMSGGTVSDARTVGTDPGVGGGITLSGTSASVTGVDFHDIDKQAFTEVDACCITITFSNNTVTRAGAGGFPAVAVFTPTTTHVAGNVVTDSGPGGYPAMEIQGTGDPSGVSGNTGAGNGVDAIELTWGATADFHFVSPTNNTAVHPLGFVLNGLNMAPGTTLVVPPGAVVKTMKDTDIALSSSRIDATAGGAVFTSIRDNSVGITACPSALAPDCNETASDWRGIWLSNSSNVDMVGGRVRDATIDFVDPAMITLGTNYGRPAPGAIHLTDTVLEHSAGATWGVQVAMTGGRVSDLETTGDPYGLPAYDYVGKGFGLRGDGVVADRVTFQDLAGPAVWSTNGTITNSTFTRVGTGGYAGILLDGDHLRLTGNTITSSGGAAGAPAVALTSFTGDLASAVSGNQVASNAIDAAYLNLVTQTVSMTWPTTLNGSSPHPLGYVGSVTVQGPGVTLTVPNGAIVRTALKLEGARLDASAGGAEFAGPSAQTGGFGWCSTPTVDPAQKIVRSQPGQRGCILGIEDTSVAVGYDGNGNRATALIVGATFHDYTSTIGGANIVGDPVDGPDPAVVVTDTVMRDGSIGLSMGLRMARVHMTVAATAIQVSNATADLTDVTIDGGAIYLDVVVLSRGDPSHTVSVVRMHINAASSLRAMRIDGDHSIVRDNVVTSPPGHQGTAIPIQLTGALDLRTEVTGNQGAGNYADVMLLSGTSTNDLDWVSPVNSSTLHPLGFVAGSLDMAPGTTLHVPQGALVKTMGQVGLPGAHLDASVGGATFTAVSDDSIGPPTCYMLTWPAPCAQPLAPWRGVALTLGPNGEVPGAVVNGATFRMATTALDVSAGTATIAGTRFAHNGGQSGTYGSALQTDGGHVDLACSTVQSNNGGLSSGPNAITVHQSNLFGNNGDVTATVPTDARSNWWGQPGGPQPSQVSGPVDASNPLSSPASCAPAPESPTPVPPGPTPTAVARIITGPGSGGGPHVRTFSTSGGPGVQFMAGSSSLSGGVSVASGDVDGDGHDEIITGAGPGGPPVVRVFRSDGTELYDLYAFDLGFTGGVNVAAADVEGTGKADIVVAAGPGGGPNVKVLRANGSVVSSFFAYDAAFHGGVNVAAAVVGGQGVIATGPGSGGGPDVRTFTPAGVLTGSRYAYDARFVGGVNVAVGAVNGRGAVVTGPGPGGGPDVEVFEAGGNVHGFFAYDAGFAGGVTVAIVPSDTASDAVIVTGPGPGGGPHVRTFGADGQPVGGGFLAYSPNFAGGVRVAAGTP